MARKGFLALVAATILVIAAAVALTFSGRPPAAVAEAGQPVLPGLAQRIGDVASVAVKRGTAGYTLQRGQAGWTVPEKSNYPADPGKVRQALLGLADLKYVEAKTRKPDSYPRLEVEDSGKEGSKSALVEVKDSGGAKLAEIIVGKRKPDRLGAGTDGIYVRRPGDAQSWLAQGSLDLSGEAKDWLDRKVVGIPAARIKSVTIVQGDGAKLVLRREKAEDKFAVADAEADSKWKESSLGDPASGLDALELNDVRARSELPVPEGTPTTELVAFDGLTLKTAVFEKDGTWWLRLDAAGTGDAEKEAGEINARVANWVYAVPTWKANYLKMKREDLVEPAKAS